MEIFIKEGNYLLTRYEWAGGIKPKDSVIKGREKLVKKGQARIANHPDEAKPNQDGSYKIHRKGKI